MVPPESLLNCTWPALELIDPPGPVTALASRPGSGNTWVRHLLQLATGKQTGSIFHELRLKRNGFPGEGGLFHIFLQTYLTLECDI